MRWRHGAAPSTGIPLIPLLAVAVALAALAARFAVAFSASNLRIPFACPFRALTGIPCLTCGATRALAALVEGDLFRAVSFNPLVTVSALTVIVAGFASLALRVARVAVPRPLADRREQFLLRAGAAGAILANWVYLIVRL